MIRGLILIVLLATATGPSASEEWHVVLEQDGVVVSQKPVPGRELPVFRGVAELDAPLHDVLGVIVDVEQHPLWLAQCTETRILERETPFRSLHYVRIESTWPVADRDAFLASETQRLGPGRVRSSFAMHLDPELEPTPGIVRMARLRGHYALDALGPQKTRVEYLVDADPAGRLPRWLVRRTALENPLVTLTNLREQVAAHRGSHESLKQRLLTLEPVPDRGGE